MVPGAVWPCRRDHQDDGFGFIEAVLYRYRAGIPWRDLPERLGNSKNARPPVQP